MARGSLHTPEVRGDPGTRARVLGHGPPRSPRTPSAPPGSRLRVGSGRPPTPRAVQPSGLALPLGVGRRPPGKGTPRKVGQGGAPEPKIYCGPPPHPPPGTCVAREHTHKNKTTISSRRKWPPKASLCLSVSVCLFFQGLEHTALTGNFDFSSPNDLSRRPPGLC